MNEDQHRKWDILIKGIITPIIAVITVLFGIYQYTDSQKKTMEREFQLRKIERQEQAFEEKTKLYKETRQVLAFLSTNNELGSVLFESKKNRFWELYWGDLASVESPQIESLMVRFGSLLTKLENPDEADKESIQSNLQQISLDFSHQTQSELNEE
jgi:hypothetical protein